jgi:hypothetical protein
VSTKLGSYQQQVYNLIPEHAAITVLRLIDKSDHGQTVRALEAMRKKGIIKIYDSQGEPAAHVEWYYWVARATSMQPSPSTEIIV